MGSFLGNRSDASLNIIISRKTGCDSLIRAHREWRRKTPDADLAILEKQVIWQSSQKPVRGSWALRPPVNIWCRGRGMLIPKPISGVELPEANDGCVVLGMGDQHML